MSTPSEVIVVEDPDLIPSKRLKTSAQDEHSDDDDKKTKEVVVKKNYILEQDDDDEFITYMWSDDEDIEAVQSGDMPEEEELSDEDYLEYCRLVDESEGYDCGSFNVYEPGMIVQAGEAWYPKIDEFVRQALDEYNKDNKTRLVFDKIVKANVQVGCVATYYVTFDAKDTDDGCEIKTFQTRIWDKVNGIEVQQVRLKPYAAA